MMRIASMVVNARPGYVPLLRDTLMTLHGVEVVETKGDSVAVLLEARTPRAQRQMHERINDLDEVESVALVFQSGEV